MIKINCAVNKTSRICLEIGGETYANKTKGDKTAR